MELTLSQEILLIALPSTSIEVYQKTLRFNGVDGQNEKNFSCSEKNNPKLIAFLIGLRVIRISFRFPYLIPRPESGTKKF